MTKEKKIWLIEQYAHKTWTVCLVLAQEAARAGKYGKGYAVVASEARRLAESMFEYIANTRFDSHDEALFENILNIAYEMKYLAINADIEIQGMAKISMDYNIPKSMAVFAEELRVISIKLNELSNNSISQKPFTLFELSSPSNSSPGVESYFFYSIGGYPLIENLKNITEITFSPKINTEGDLFSIRGKKIPIINCFRSLNLPLAELYKDMQTIIIINPNGERTNFDRLYAILIDELDINALIHSQIGSSVPSKKEHAFAEYARDCWDLVCGDQVVFANWEKLFLLQR